MTTFVWSLAKSTQQTVAAGLLRSYRNDLNIIATFEQKTKSVAP